MLIFLKKAVILLLLGGLLWVAACATNTGPAATPSTSSFTLDPSDPQFWPMWVDRQGGG